MASLLTCAITSVTWCFCTACTSLLSSCCGNDKPSTMPASITSGRKRSVCLLVVGIAIALGFQYGVAPYVIAHENLAKFVYVHDSWMQGCDALGTAELQTICVANNSVYRVMSVTTLYFVLAAVAVACRPTANREAWPAKIVLYLFAVFGFCFIPNDPFFSIVYLNIGRIGGIIFIFMQQLVIIDLAYNWNDSWVEKSNQAERDETGSGAKWLHAILASCAILFGAALGALIYMFVAFTGCPSNDAFISLTLVFCILITAAQLSGEESSLLSSACISAWAVYLVYGAVTKNLNEVCNPTINDPTPATIVLGLAVTVLSLGYTGWSYTAEDKLRVRDNNANDDGGGAATAYVSSSQQSNGGRKVTGVVVTGTTSSATYGTADEHGGAGEQHSPNGEMEDDENNNDSYDDPTHLSNSWRLNVALAAVACWTAMILTHWGSVQTRGTIANPSASNVAMWIVVASQWLVLLLYLWTLVAPRVFPDRDFS